MSETKKLSERSVSLPASVVGQLVALVVGISGGGVVGTHTAAGDLAVQMEAGKIEQLKALRDTEHKLTTELAQARVQVAALRDQTRDLEQRLGRIDAALDAARRDHVDWAALRLWIEKARRVTGLEQLPELRRESGR